MKTYYDTNLNYYIKIKLTEAGRIIYKKYYAKYNCEAPELNIDDEGYVRFQIYDFMHIFGERLFMGATLPCETNCKIQVKDEWHYVKDELPTNKKVCLLYLGNGYNPIIGWFENNAWCFEDGRNADIWQEYVIAWKEIVLPEE